MSAAPPLGPALVALEDCDTALSELEAACCEPGRSPRMKALAATLADARARIDPAAGIDLVSAEAALVVLDDAGAQVGRLQVGCCAPNRLPLYAAILEGLTTVQVTVNRALDRGH